MKTDTGGQAYPSRKITYKHQQDNIVEYIPGMTLLDRAALAAFPEKLRCFHNEDAVKHAYEAGEAFIAEKRRREE